jgi:hypothetical protein
MGQARSAGRARDDAGGSFKSAEICASIPIIPFSINLVGFPFPAIWQSLPPRVLARFAQNQRK